MWRRSVNGRSNSPSSNFVARIRDTASSIRRIETRPALTSSVSVAMNSRKVFGSIAMSMPALMPVRTWVGQSPGIWWMPSQSLITSPSKSSLPLSVPSISSRWACILSGLPTPSSVQSTLENDGITLPTSCLRTAGTYWRSDVRQNSRRLMIVTPWSIW